MTRELCSFTRDETEGYYISLPPIARTIFLNRRIDEATTTTTTTTTAAATTWGGRKGFIHA